MREFRTRDEELDFLRRRTRELEERIEQLVYQIEARNEVDEFEALAVMNHYKLPLARARILWMLSSGRPQSRERLMDHYASDYEVDLRNVDHQIKRIRQVATDIPIRAIYGYGYQMEPPGMKRIKQIIEEAKAVRAAEAASKSEIHN